METLFPTDRELMEEAILEDESLKREMWELGPDDPVNDIALDKWQMMDPPTSPIPGSEWQAPKTKSEIYFDAVRLAETLMHLANDLQNQGWHLTTAIRNVRLAKNVPDYVSATSHLTRLYFDTRSNLGVEIKVRMAVDDLANTIDADVPPSPKMDGGNAIYPSMDHYYTLRPVWEFINKARRAFKRADA